jgi:hypothetical protein
LLRIASAFDIGLEVGFAPFGAVVDRAERFDPDTFEVASFEDEVHDADERVDRGVRSKPSAPAWEHGTPRRAAPRSRRGRPASKPASRT